jgi:hypothetical protein
MTKRRQQIREADITFRRLGKDRPTHRSGCKTPFGVCWKGTGRIHIDPRQSEEELLDTLVHELVHDVQPFLVEDAVDNIGIYISKALWKQGYRRIR